MNQEELIPLFPLSVVLFPRTLLPLHIFEERYKEMIGEVMGEASEFGVVLAKDSTIVSSGCTGIVEEVLHRYDDGRMDILARGQRRFKIVEIVQDKAYLQGKVTFFDDYELPQPPMELKQKAMEGYRAARRATGQEVDEPEWSDPQLSFQLARLVEDLEFRQKLLNSRGEQERLQELADYFPTHVQRFRHIAALKDAAPRNGHSKHIPISE